MLSEILTFASLFTGGGGVDQGARIAGLKHLWGVEIDSGYAAIAQKNGFNTIVQDIRTVHFRKMKSPDWLHASPPCVRASVANPNQGEDTLDVELALAVVSAIAALQPMYFSLENVLAYRRFNSCALIRNRLSELGYSLVEGVLNAADYGVPQTRKRLFIVGSRAGRRPVLPMPTHHRPSRQIDLFSEPWVSWADALKTVEPPLKYQLTDRLQAMIPSSFFGTALMTGWNQYTGCNRSGLTSRRKEMPSPTLLSKMTQPSMRPMIIERYHSETKARVLDISHMAALQGFPLYQWGTSRTKAREAIGNAVPPLVMQRIIETNVRESKALQGQPKYCSNAAF